MKNVEIEQYSILVVDEHTKGGGANERLRYLHIGRQIRILRDSLDDSIPSAREHPRPTRIPIWRANSVPSLKNKIQLQRRNAQLDGRAFILCRKKDELFDILC